MNSLIVQKPLYASSETLFQCLFKRLGELGAAVRSEGSERWAELPPEIGSGVVRSSRPRKGLSIDIIDGRLHADTSRKDYLTFSSFRFNFLGFRFQSNYRRVSFLEIDDRV